MPLASKNTYLKELGLLLSRVWPENRTVNIVCHGHSVPSGYFGFTLVKTFSAYPHILHRRLNKRYPMSVINTITTGIGGENSEKGAGRFSEDVLCHKPDLITIDYGLNDRNIGLPRAESSWTSMIEKALEKSIKIILLTPSGRIFDGDEGEASLFLDECAEQIRSLADKYGVGLADSSGAFKKYCENSGELSDLMSWKNHPNKKGHELIADEIMRWFPIPVPGR